MYPLPSTERMVAGVTSNPHVWLGLCVVFSCVAGLLCILLCCCFQVRKQIYCNILYPCVHN